MATNPTPPANPYDAFTQRIVRDAEERGGSPAMPADEVAVRNATKRATEAFRDLTKRRPNEYDDVAQQPDKYDQLRPQTNGPKYAEKK